jgi:hypothetical protein
MEFNFFAKKEYKYIDKLIYEKLGGIYSPGEDVDININNDEERNRKYLGTYFPRSLAESYCLFNFLLNIEKYKNILLNKKEIKILDLGAGTGGNLSGMFYAFIECVPAINNFNIITIDGHKESFRYQKIFIDNFISHFKKNIYYTTCLGKADSKKGIGDYFARANEYLGTEKFDIIMSFKFLSELYNENPQGTNKHCFDLFNIVENYLTETGILSLVDITAQDKKGTRDFMPYIINKELNDYLRQSDDLKILLPSICGKYSPCINPGECYRQRVMIVKQKERNNKSNFYYVVLGKNQLVTELSSELKISKEVSYKYKYNKETKDYEEICNGICDKGRFKRI